MMIDSVIWAQYINMTDTQTANALRRAAKTEKCATKDWLVCFFYDIQSVQMEWIYSYMPVAYVWHNNTNLVRRQLQQNMNHDRPFHLNRIHTEYI